MAKYKGIFYRNPNKQEPQVVASSSSKEQLIEDLVDFCGNKGLLCGCETSDEVRQCLEERDYYLFLNPWELVIEESK